jgi:hypothetical protein
VKKLFSRFCLMLLLMQVAGGYIYFWARLSVIRQEMRQQLRHRPDDQLTLLVLTQDEFKKARVDDHEVKVDGKMFDIARYEVENDTVKIYALHDRAEDNLLAFVNELIRRSAHDKKPVPTQLIQLVSLIFIPCQQVELTHRQLSVHHHTPYRFPSTGFITEVENPPPRV